MFIAGITQLNRTKGFFYLTFWQRPWIQKWFPQQAQIANQNSLFTWHDMLHYSLNIRPTLWMMWGLVMQQDKKSSHMFVFSVDQTAALICHVRSKSTSELNDNQCILQNELSLTPSKVTWQSYWTYWTSPPEHQVSMSHKQRETTGTRAVWKICCLWLVIFILLQDIQLGAPHFEILFIFTSWIFHTAWVSLFWS